MCIVLDTNCFSSVFDPTSSDHHVFKPVYDWVNDRNGFFVYGGSKYLQELKGMTKYLKIFNDLKDKRKVKRLEDSDEIDRIENEVIKLIRNNRKSTKRYNDAHLVAIIRVSKCRLVCTGDKGAMALLADSSYYQSSKERPKIYSRLAQKKLLTDKKFFVASLCP